MRKKTIILSIGVGLLVLFLPLHSVSQKLQTPMNSESLDDISPLFNHRLRQTKAELLPVLGTRYMGKGRTIPLVLTPLSNIDVWITQGAQLFTQNPERYLPIIRAVIKQPDIALYLTDYETRMRFEQMLNEMGHQPEMLYQNLAYVLQQIEISEFPIADPPQPVGFSGQPGCLIAFFIILPVLIMIATMIATFTIITCLNIGGCFGSIMQNIFEGFSQGLQNGL